MALSPQLLNFKSSGVYRLEFDKSQTANIDVETLRLVVGHSRKGPYNTPVLIDSVEAFENTFGTIDKNLEKRGMFFHRSALEALTRGPILALNTAAFKESDTASYQRPVTNGSIHSVDSVGADDKEYTSFFDNDKFMIPSDQEVLSSLGSVVGETHLLNFVNIKQESITIITRQAQDVKEFEITAREWYGEGNVPSYLNEFDRMSDFMVDIFVFKGEFDAELLKNDPIYGEFFNTGLGLNKEALAKFANLRQVSLIAQYTGSILPGFKDLEGRNMYVETMVNAEARRTGLFCAIDEDAVLEETGTGIDFVGHSYDADQDYELLSHRVEQTAVEDVVTIPAAGAPTATPYSITTGATLNDHNGGTNNKIIVVGQDITADITDAKFLLLDDGTYVQIDSVAYDGVVNSEIIVTGELDASYDLGAATPGTINIYDSATGTVITTEVAANVLTARNVDLENGQYAMHTQHYLLGLAGEYVHIDSISFDGTDTTITCDGQINSSYNNLTNVAASFELIDYDITNPRVSEEELDGGVYTAINGGTNFTVFYNDIANAPGSFPISIGDYVPSYTADAGYTGGLERIARVTRIAKSVDSATTPNTATYTVYCDIAPAQVWNNQIIHSFENASSQYKTFVLKGASINSKTITECLTAVTGGTGLYDALVDKDVIDFRYIVDTFGSYDAGILNKSQLSQLAKDRQNASAILNAPTVAEFKLSTDPSFKNALTGKFDTAYIASGGNQDLNPTKTYTLPSINEGANYAFYYGPGLIVSDNGKDLIVPPAAYVSNNYLDKYTNALPWSIVAGPRRGVVAGKNVKGTEYSFDKNDRDILEPFGINPIVFQRGVGLTILGNKTAQQSIKSALSSAHVREVLIYIQDGMADILKDYVFEFNNVQTRLEIKTLADSFLESVKQDGGVYEFKNVMDQSNNTSEVIDNNMGIIDTYVEPVKGLEIVVHRTTILNTGEIQSGNLG